MRAKGGARPGAGRKRKEGGAKTRTLYCSENEHKACKNLIAFVRALESDRVERTGMDEGFAKLQPATFWGLLTGGEIWTEQEKDAARLDMWENLAEDTMERMQEAFPFLVAKK